jgi:predicted dehydrogenase
MLADGAIGELREIQSDFHFLMTDAGTNVRMSTGLAGGALLDVGCYPVRLAREVFGAEHEAARAQADHDAGGVDVATWGCLDFPGGRHLYLSCGFGRADDTGTRLLGTGGQINITNPFHPAAGDIFVVRAAGRGPVTHRGTGPNRHSFTPIIQHIHAVMAGTEAPRLLAVDTSLGSARALRDLAASAAG